MMAGGSTELQTREGTRKTEVEHTQLHDTEHRSRVGNDNLSNLTPAVTDS